jgi:hypothetical protein
VDWEVTEYEKILAPRLKRAWGKKGVRELLELLRKYDEMLKELEKQRRELIEALQTPNILHIRRVMTETRWKAEEVGHDLKVWSSDLSILRDELVRKYFDMLRREEQKEKMSQTTRG